MRMSHHSGIEIRSARDYGSSKESWAMSLSLTQFYKKGKSFFERCKPYKILHMNSDKSRYIVPAKYVPAAAVKHMGQALFGITGRIGKQVDLTFVITGLRILKSYSK